MSEGTETKPVETHEDADPSTSREDAWSEESLSAPFGRSIDRYVVLEQLGRGGMGRVLRAYDPKLEREVALKQLRPDKLDTDAQARLVREARAMAKLSHPNVVGVYDVEDTPAGLVLVMEHVRGPTLRAWLSKRHRPWTERMARFLEAGRGLAAAHAEGLLHRDFKPANVLLPPQGGAKVTDFGLAKLVAGPGDEAASGEAVPDDASPDSLDTSLTREGAVLGTPIYMAPEQHHGQATDAAVDQYAFCVSLWEALTGQPPFRGRTFELALRKRKGPPPWPDDVTIPRPVVKALRRGLAVDPSSRWPDMNALLAALAFDPARRRRRVLLAVGSVGVLGLGVASAQWWLDRRAQRCTGAAAQLAGIWDDERRTEVEATLRDTGVHYADDVWSRIAPRLDDYAQAWTDMHTEACAETTIHARQPVRVMDLRMACLHRARMQLQAAADVLANADAEVVHRAHRVVDGLRSLDRCADIDALQEAVEPPSPEEAEEVELIRLALLRSEALRKAGRYEQARESLERARALLTQVGYEPVGTEVALEQGYVFDRLAEWETAERSFRRAIGRGVRFGQWVAVREAATKLLHLIGDERARPDQGLRYRELAMGLAHGDVVARADVHSSLGNLEKTRGKYPEALEEHRYALALRLEALGPRHLDVASSRNNIASVLHAQGRYAESEAELRQALAVRQERLGSRHPDVAMTRNNLGIALHDQGRLEDAEAEFRRVLELRIEVLGPDHLSVMDSHNSVGIALYDQGKYAEAEAQFRYVWEGKRKLLDPDHPQLTNIRSNIASTLSAQGRYAEAEAEYREILVQQRKIHDPGHPYIANTHANLGNALNAQGNHVLAEAEYRKALALRQEALGPEHPKIADMHDSLGLALKSQDRYEEAEVQLRQAVAMRKSLLGEDSDDLATSRMRLSNVLLDRARAEEALPLARQAWARLQREDVRVAKRADAAWALARALAANGVEPKRARELGRKALGLYKEEGGTEVAVIVAEVEAWLRERR